MVNGICTLANDYVFDQVVALLNSIDVHAGKDFPVCIYPYDDRIQRLQDFLQDRPHIQIYDDQNSIRSWDTRVEKIWQYHPTAQQQWFEATGNEGIHRMGTHRRFCAFDGPFDQFIYMDADTLLLDSPKPIFDLLSDFDWITYDFQYKDLSHVFDVKSSKLQQLFSDEQLEKQVFCSGFYASKRQTIHEQSLDFYFNKLMEGDAEVLYPMAPDQTILNYFVLRQPLKSNNLALSLPIDQRTGNSVTSKHFEQRGDSVFDQGKRLLYLHYIGVSSKLFTRVCQGENIDIPYRDVFLNYRYKHSPENRPELQGSVTKHQPQRPPLWKRLVRKLSLSQ